MRYPAVLGWQGIGDSEDNRAGGQFGIYIAAAFQSEQGG